MLATKLVLLSSLFDLHISGGYPFMIPLTLMLIINLGILIYILVARIQQKVVDPAWQEAIKQIGGLAAAWGTWATITGLFFAFDALESAKDTIPFNVICGGLKAALITVLYGLLIFCMSLFAYILLKLTFRSSAA